MEKMPNNCFNLTHAVPVKQMLDGSSTAYTDNTPSFWHGLSGGKDGRFDKKKKRLMQWPKGDLAERLLFAYSTIQSLQAEKLHLAKSLYLAANDFTSSNGSVPDWWKECKDVARKTLELNCAKNTEQQLQPDTYGAG